LAPLNGTLPPMLIHQLLIDGANRRPEKAAFTWVDRGKTLTYAEAVAQTDRFAGALAELGVKKGDRVSIVAHNGMDYLLAMFGCWRMGAIASLVNVKFANELDYYFRDHEPVVAIYTQDLVDQVKRGAAGVTSVRALVCMDGPQEGALSLPALLGAGLPPPPDPADEDAIAHLSYTSGTTGRPKGACLSHEPTVRATRCIAERLRLSSEDSSFGPTALSSSYQLVANLLPALHHTMSICVMGKWNPEAGWRKLDENRSTVLAANPTFLTDVLLESRRQRRPPRGLRMGLSGGGPVPPPLKKAWRDVLGLPLVESYGQSELGGFVGLGSPDLPSDARMGAIGRPLPDKEVRIFDSGSKEVSAGELGEICIRGGFMKGYWGKPEKSAEATRGGWLHTGDAGTMDADGYVTLRGRFSELLNVGGRTWFPRDVEEALCGVPGVQAAALVGLPVGEGEHRPVAFVIAEAVGFDGRALLSAIAPAVPYDLESMPILLLPEFPMTPTGKIAKADLRDQAAAGKFGAL